MNTQKNNLEKNQIIKNVNFGNSSSAWNLAVQVSKTACLGFAMFLLLFLNSCAYNPGGSSKKIEKLQTNLVSKKASKHDFDFPTHPPSLVKGEEVYKQSCAVCHGSKPGRLLSKSYMRSKTPEEQYEVVVLGNSKGMPGFREKLTREERWDALLYLRASMLGYFEESSAKAAYMEATFGGNCAVCHGSRGHGDGPLHKSLHPQPANFTQFHRLYTRSDDKLFDEISHGIPWTAMPAWAGRYDFDKKEFFDEQLRWDLVRYVRSFAFKQGIDRLDEGRKKLEEHKEKILKAKN